MKHDIPDRRLVPPEPPEPVEQCWWCNDDIWPDYQYSISILKGEDRNYPYCGSDKCAEAIAVEEGWDKEYEEIEKEENLCEDYTLAEYVQNEYEEYVHIMTEEDFQLMQAEEM